VEAESWRLCGREEADKTVRYPELAALWRLPAGSQVDGKLVMRRAGWPDLAAALGWHWLVDPWQIRHAKRWCLVRYARARILSPSVFGHLTPNGQRVNLSVVGRRSGPAPNSLADARMAPTIPLLLLPAVALVALDAPQRHSKQ
jgi:hypothetical protein